jgi:hypothetical protein
MALGREAQSESESVQWSAPQMGAVRVPVLDSSKGDQSGPRWGKWMGSAGRADIVWRTSQLLHRDFMNESARPTAVGLTEG